MRRDWGGWPSPIQEVSRAGDTAPTGVQVLVTGKEAGKSQVQGELRTDGAPGLCPAAMRTFRFPGPLGHRLLGWGPVSLEMRFPLGSPLMGQ